MYYIISTDDRYAFDLEKYETLKEATKALKDYPWNYDYKAIIKGDMIFETDDFNQENNTIKTSKQKLAEAMEFHEEMLRFFAKNYPTYINELEKYAENHGFYKGWDDMIRKLQND